MSIPFKQLPKDLQREISPKRKRPKFTMTDEQMAAYAKTLPGVEVPWDQTWRKCPTCGTEVLGYDGPCEHCCETNCPCRLGVAGEPRD